MGEIDKTNAKPKKLSPYAHRRFLEGFVFVLSLTPFKYLPSEHSLHKLGLALLCVLCWGVGHALVCWLVPAPSFDRLSKPRKGPTSEFERLVVTPGTKEYEERGAEIRRDREAWRTTLWGTSSLENNELFPMGNLWFVLGGLLGFATVWLIDRIIRG